jgi:TetR/AcrR family transcriptional regulator, transcriptional repressor for nem operon
MADRPGQNLLRWHSLRKALDLDRSVKYIVLVMRQCESKLKLLRTAHELISQQSYGSVGVDQICEQSGVKKGSFYHFFRSKSELTVAAYEYHWASLQESLDRIFSAEKPPLERLDDYFNWMRQTQAERFQKYGRVLGCPFVSLGCELSTQDEDIRLMAKKISEGKRVYLENTLREAVERGDISAADPKALADELHTYLVGLVQEAKIANDAGALDRLKSGAYRLLGLHVAPAAV